MNDEVKICSTTIYEIRKIPTKSLCPSFDRIAESEPLDPGTMRKPIKVTFC